MGMEIRDMRQELETIPDEVLRAPSTVTSIWAALGTTPTPTAGAALLVEKAAKEYSPW